MDEIDADVQNQDREKEQVLLNEQLKETKVQEQKELQQKEHLIKKEITSVLEYFDPKDLEPHPKNVEIYGREDLDEGLLESIREHDQLEPIVIDQHNRIISGHRRWQTLLKLKEEEETKKKKGQEYKEIKAICFKKEFSEIDAKEAIVEFNKQRKKNPLQVYKEICLIEEVESDRAKIRQYKNLNNVEVPDLELREDEYGKTVKKISKAIGRSTGYVANLKHIGNLYDRGDDTEAIYVMDEMVAGNLSNDAGYKLMKLIEAARDPAAQVPDSSQEIKDVAVRAQGNVEKVKKGMSVNQAYNDFEKYKKDYATKPPKPLSVLLEGNYNIFVADPSSSEQAKKIKIPNAKDAVLFLWADTQSIEDRIALMREWGFNLKSIAIYDTERPEGVYFKSIIELILLGIKGDLEPAEDYRPDVIFRKGNDDKCKYETLYKIVEKMFPGEHFVDPFRETEREGWGKPIFIEEKDDLDESIAYNVF